MKNARTLEPRSHAARRAAQRITPVALACATLLFAATEIHAQQADQSVVVTGIRRAIETSVAVKRDSDSIVEAVSAEDIGKLPETSIAESLARLPGLTAQRVNGRDSVISIRGLAPKFGVTLLNGREMVSTGDNRSVEYDQFPAELINGATVYKTPDATLGAQGLSGTVNLKTVAPLSLTTRQVNFGVRGEVNANGSVVPGSSDKGNRISLSYVDQFADRTVGVALGFSHLDSPNQEKYFDSWWWGNSAIWWGAFRGLENADPAKAPATLQGFDAGVRNIKNKRDGLMAVLEYKPNKDLHSQLDLYYSKFGQRSTGREFQANLMPDWSGEGTPANPATGGPTYSNIQTVTMGPDKVVVGGTIGNVDPFVLIRSSRRDDKVMSAGWNTELKAAGWTTMADLSYSKAERNEVVGELTASAPTLSGFSSFNANTTGSSFSQYTPTGNFGANGVVQLRGISDWGSLDGAPSAGSQSPISVNDAMKALRLSARTDLSLGPIHRFEGGVNYTDRSKDTYRTQTIFALKNGVSCVNGNDKCAPIPAGILQTPADLGFVGVPSLVSFDMADALASGVYNSGPVNVSSAPGRIWGVGEKVTTLYGQLGLEFTAGIPFRGNLGLQVVRTQQRSTGVAWDSVANKTVNMNFGTSYTDVLPSLNLVGDLGANTVLRLGAAKTLARPNMDDMRAGFSAGVATSGAKLGQWSGSGGNPYLEPWRANALDLSIEKYLSKRSYISAAAFRKNLKSSIYVDTFNFDFSGFPNSTGIKPVANIGTLTAPINGKGGYIEGFELSAALDFALISPSLDGFGAVLTGSHNHSNLAGHANDGKKDLNRTIEGLSGDVNALSIYYEKSGWQARIGQRYRSKYIAEVRGVWIDNSLAAIEAEKVTDVQVGYSWESGPLKGVSVLFQVNNLTNTPYRTSLQDDSSTSTPMRMMPERYNEYGRRYLLGLNYKL